MAECLLSENVWWRPWGIWTSLHDGTVLKTNNGSGWQKYAKITKKKSESRIEDKWGREAVLAGKAEIRNMWQALGIMYSVILHFKKGNIPIFHNLPIDLGLLPRHLWGNCASFGLSVPGRSCSHGGHLIGVGYCILPESVMVFQKDLKCGFYMWVLHHVFFLNGLQTMASFRHLAKNSSLSGTLSMIYPNEVEHGGRCMSSALYSKVAQCPSK